MFNFFKLNISKLNSFLFSDVSTWITEITALSLNTPTPITTSVDSPHYLFLLVS